MLIRPTVKKLLAQKDDITAGSQDRRWRHADERRGGVGGYICTLDVTPLLQNGQFIPAFKSLIGRRLKGIIQHLLEATEAGRLLHVRERHQPAAKQTTQLHQHGPPSFSPRVLQWGN